jgi:hypothetical protein
MSDSVLYQKFLETWKGEVGTVNLKRAKAWDSFKRKFKKKNLNVKLVWKSISV